MMPRSAMTFSAFAAHPLCFSRDEIADELIARERELKTRIWEKLTNNVE